MMIIKRREYVSSSKYDPISSDFSACINHDSSFRVDALKSTFLKGDLEAVGQPSKVPNCHSEPFGKLKTGSAKNLINLDTYAFEILRLTPQNDIFGQPL